MVGMITPGMQVLEWEQAPYLNTCEQTLSLKSTRG